MSPKARVKKMKVVKEGRRSPPSARNGEMHAKNRTITSPTPKVINKRIPPPPQRSEYQKSKHPVSSRSWDSPPRNDRNAKRMRRNSWSSDSSHEDKKFHRVSPRREHRDKDRRRHDRDRVHHSRERQSHDKERVHHDKERPTKKGPGKMELCSTSRGMRIKYHKPPSPKIIRRSKKE